MKISLHGFLPINLCFAPEATASKSILVLFILLMNRLDFSKQF